LNTHRGPTTAVKASKKVSIANQQVVDVIISILSLGANKSQLGSKWEPDLPGLLFHCTGMGQWNAAVRSFLCNVN